MMKMTLSVISAVSWMCAASAIASVPPSTGNPATANTSAGINILNPITITEDQSLDFGKVIAPATGHAFFVVQADISGAIQIGIMPGAAAPAQHVSGGQKGHITVTGTTGYDIDFQANIIGGGCSSPHIVLQTIDPANSTNTLDYTTDITGKIRVASAVPTGGHTCQYTLQAQYQ